jgi:hypothetical protein
MSDNRPFIAVDLDGVLAQYSGWQGIDHIGDPVPGAAEFMKALSKHGRVTVFTTRCNTQVNKETPKALAARVQKWLDKHSIKCDEVYTGTGKPLAVAYVDDRAVVCRPQAALDKGHDPEFDYARAVEAVQALLPKDPPRPATKARQKGAKK